jgi:hypothetical protein
MHIARLAFIALAGMASSLLHAQDDPNIAATIYVKNAKHTGDSSECSLVQAFDNVEVGGIALGPTGKPANACEAAAKTGPKEERTWIELGHLTAELANPIYHSSNWAVVANGTIEGNATTHMFTVVGPNTWLSISHATLQNGYSSGSGGCVRTENGARLGAFAVVFDGCVADENGGAIASYGGGYLNIHLSSFKQNEARAGGALWKEGGAAQIRYTMFEDNRARYYGGAIYNQYSRISLSESRVEGNFVALDPVDPVFDGAGGGIYNAGRLIMDLVNVENNYVGLGDGGGLYLESNSEEVKITRSRIHDNESGNFGSLMDAGFDGGGIYSNSRFTLKDTTVSGNTAHDNGGGIAIASAAAGAEIAIENSTLIGNSAALHGGALWVTSEPMTKTADDTSPFGEKYKLQILNSTISHNISAEQVWLGQGPKADKEILFVNNIVESDEGPACGGYVGRLLTKRINDASVGVHNTQLPGTSCGTEIPSAAALASPINGWYYNSTYQVTSYPLPADHVVCTAVGDRDQFGTLRECLVGAVEDFAPAVNDPPLYAP